MKLMNRTALAGVLAFGVAVFLSGARADDASSEGASFSGKVSSVDKSAQTVTVKGQVYQLLPTSQIKKNGEMAQFNEISVGDRLSGTYKRSSEGKMEVLTAQISEKNQSSSTGGTKDSATSGSGASFEGKVSKVDRTDKTVMVGKQTYQVLPTTSITVNGAPATFDDIRKDRRVSGSYKTSAEGKMELLNIELGRTPASHRQ